MVQKSMIQLKNTAMEKKGGETNVIQMKLLIKAGDKLVHKSMFFTYSCSYQAYVFNYISTTPTLITKYLYRTNSSPTKP
jgi:hypothetical protein